MMTAFYAFVDRFGWALLMAAGLFEILWAYTLKMSDGYTRLWPTLATIPFGLMSAALLAMAMRTIPMSTAYMVWLGIGAMGTVVVGHYIYQEPMSLLRVGCVTLIMVGIIGLKLINASTAP